QFMQANEEESFVQYENSGNYSPLSSMVEAWERKDWSQDDAFSELALDINRVILGTRSCLKEYAEYFSKEHSRAKSQVVVGQTNSFRYRRVGNYTLRVQPKDSLADVLLRLFAGVIAGNKVFVSIAENQPGNTIMEFLESQFLDSLRNRFSLKVQNDATLLSHILGNRIDRLAYTHP
ncbi:hypothetical protein CO130_02790, partial [Candidatus Jorgensenbacteria bacterium CG_4_9_14_3_um_filter_38_10]